MKLYNLPDEIATPGFRQIRKKEIKKIYPMLQEYLAKFKVSLNFEADEAVHFLNPREGIIYSYVVEDPTTKELTDFISFYALPSTVLDSDKHDKINAAYSYYTVATKTDFQQLFKDAIIMAKKEGFDVFNALDIMDNAKVFEDLRFKRGDGNLHYYLFNYRLPEVNPSELGIVLV